ncbi:MAG: PEP-CTERM sorting domain-containing protein [Gemmatimonas sp.]
MVHDVRRPDRLNGSWVVSDVYWSGSSVSVLPEPSIDALFATGLMGVAVISRRRLRRNAT